MKKQSIVDLLKPKSPNQILEDFAASKNISDWDLKKFMRKYNYDKRFFALLLCILIFVFSISLIITGLDALKQQYFWLPIHQTHSMLSFINVFWVVSWFSISVFLIIYAVIKSIRIFDGE